MLLGALLAAKSSSSGTWLLLAIVVLYFLIWYFYLRPRWARNRQNRLRGPQVEVGDTIQTVGGLIATVVSLEDRKVTLRTDSGVTLDFVRAAIAGKYQPPPVGEPEPEPDDTTTEGDEH